MTAYGEIMQGDTTLVVVDSVDKIGVSIKDTAGAPTTPQELSLLVTDSAGNMVLEDVYLPVSARSPNPPRILNPSTGEYTFPFGLDNGSTDGLRTNRTSCTGDFLFYWKSALVAMTRASVSINPLTWTAVIDGTPGNFISVEYVNPGTPLAALALSRSGSKIVVSLATDGGSAPTTTAGDVITEINTHDDILEIISVALAPGFNTSDPLAVAPETLLEDGVDADGEDQVCINVKVVSHRLCNLLNKLRLLIDKTHKLIKSDPTDPCFLGYTNGQLCMYLEEGLQIINSYQPYVGFTFNTFPYGMYDFIWVETSLLAGLSSQSLFAIDTDVPNFSDSGNSFLITHSTQLAQYLNWLTQRLDRLIPQFKLHFVNSGSIHIEMGPNVRLAALISASPSGSLFRNLYSKVI